MSIRRGNMQVHPVRWIFIKSPIPRQPYRQVRKIYEVELSNTVAGTTEKIDKEKLLKARERTRKVLIQKQRKEAFQNLIVITVLLAISVLVVLFLLK